MKLNKLKHLLIVVCCAIISFNAQCADNTDWKDKSASIATFTTVGTATGHFIGKYVIFGMMLASEPEREDRGVLGGLIINAGKGHAKNSLADFFEEYGGKIGGAVGGAIGGCAGYVVSDIISPSFKKLYSYYSADNKSNEEPSNSDYVITIGTSSIALMSSLYLINKLK